MSDRQLLRATAFSRPLPEKKYFKIGEVASLVGVEPHVLRYWETQFPQVRPHKARSGHRLYRRREVEVLLVIKELLHVQRFTIAGARQALRAQGAQSLVPQSGFGDTLPPQQLEATFEGPSPSMEGEPDGELDAVESVEVEALDGDALLRAMEEQRHESRTAGLVEVEVVAALAPDIAPVAPARPAARAEARGDGDGRPSALAQPAFALQAHLARQRRMLEDALSEARGLLAFLDQTDTRAAGRPA